MEDGLTETLAVDRRSTEQNRQHSREERLPGAHRMHARALTLIAAQGSHTHAARVYSAAYAQYMIVYANPAEGGALVCGGCTAV